MHHPPQSFYTPRDKKPPWIPPSPNSKRAKPYHNSPYTESELLHALRNQSKDLMKKLKRTDKQHQVSWHPSNAKNSCSQSYTSKLAENESLPVPVPPPLPVSSPPSSPKHIGPSHLKTVHSQPPSAEVLGEELFKDSIREISGGHVYYQNMGQPRTEVQSKMKAPIRTNVKDDNEKPLPPPQPTDPSILHRFLFPESSSSPRSNMRHLSPPKTVKLHEDPPVRPISPIREILNRPDEYFKTLQKFRMEHPSLFFKNPDNSFETGGGLHEREIEFDEGLNFKPISSPSLESAGKVLSSHPSRYIKRPNPYEDKYTSGYFTVNDRFYIQPIESPFGSFPSIPPSSLNPPNIIDTKYEELATDEQIAERVFQKANARKKEFLLQEEPPVKVSLPHSRIQHLSLPYKPHRRTSFDSDESVSLRDHLHMGYQPYLHSNMKLKEKTGNISWNRFVDLTMKQRNGNGQSKISEECLIQHAVN